MSFHDQNIPAFESRATKRKNRQLIASTTCMLVLESLLDQS